MEIVLNAHLDNYMTHQLKDANQYVISVLHMMQESKNVEDNAVCCKHILTI